MTYLISQPTQFLHLKGVRNHMDSASQPTLSEKSAKSIFASKTFWGDIEEYGGYNVTPADFS